MEGLRLVGPDDGELAVGEVDIGFRSLEHLRREFLALRDDAVARPPDGAAAHGCRTATAGTARIHGEIGVALHDADILEGNPELFGDDLRIGGLVALAVRLVADQHRRAPG